MNTSGQSQSFPIPVAPAPAAAASVPPRKTLKTILGLAITKLCLALLIIIWLTVLLAEDFDLSLGGYLTALGVVKLLLVTGSIGITASQRENKCWMVAFLVLCTISIFFTAVIIITYSIGLANEYGDDGPHKYGFYDCIDYGDYADSECRYGGISKRGSKERLIYGMYGLVLIFFFVEMMIAIVASAYSCHALCGCCREEPQMRVAYVIRDEDQGYMRPLPVPISGKNKGMGPVDMSGSRPPSYASLEGTREEAAQEYSKVGGVETV